MPVPLFLLLLRSSPSFCRAFAEDFEGKWREDVVNFAIQFPNGGVERTSIDARCRCRRGRVLRVRILLYSGSIEGLYERDIRKIKQEKLYAKADSTTFTFQFRSRGVERTSINARRRRSRGLRAHIMVYSASTEGDDRIKARKTIRQPRLCGNALKPARTAFCRLQSCSSLACRLEGGDRASERGI